MSDEFVKGAVISHIASVAFELVPPPPPFYELWSLAAEFRSKGPVALYAKRVDRR